ncbi:MAG TPA: hypothetical protein VGH27_15180 [Streptosporangiaceae bacterium]|jgi:hypothetical protein
MMRTGPEDGAVSPLREALTVCAASGTSGALRITGDPGGTIHLADGLVTAIETAGAPSAEVLLLRSRRLTDAQWDAAFAAATAAGHPMSTELAARGLVGAGELEALLLTALADAMFAVASGIVEEYRAEPGAQAVTLPLDTGAVAEGLLAEAARRLKVLAALPAGFRHERLAAAPETAPGAAPSRQGHEEILALADGRRTPRDLAFALGRGVYATTLQLARMHEAGLLVATSSQPGPHLRPASGTAPEPGGGLPRRIKGAFTRTRAPVNRSPEVRPPLGLLRPRSDRDTSPGQLS